MEKVALIGPPDAGKSTIFCLFTGKPFLPRPPVKRLTRDRHYKVVEIYDKEFVLIDTGGIIFSEEEMDKLVLKQSKIAMNEADIILFVVDGRKGITPLVKNISKILHKKGKHVILVINKIDHKKHEADSFEFEKLGWKNSIRISALHKINLEQFYDLIYKNIKKDKFEESKIDLTTLITGKQNAGKSTLFNKILKEKRSIVSEKPGTTREPVEALFEYKNLRILIKDTAGIPRKLHGKEIEIFNWQHILYEIDNIESVILIIDLTKGITRQDKRILHFLIKKGLPFIIAGNKADIVKINEKSFKDMIKTELPFIISPDTVLISAISGYGINTLLDKLIQLKERNSSIFRREDLRKILENYREIFMSKGIVIKDITQVATSPIVLRISFKSIRKRKTINEKKIEKIIKNIFYKSFYLCGVPLIIKFKKVK